MISRKLGPNTFLFPTSFYAPCGPAYGIAWLWIVSVFTCASKASKLMGVAVFILYR